MKFAPGFLLLLTVSCTHSIHHAALPASPPQPAAAAGGREYFLDSRLAPGMTDLPVERYNAARDHIANMPPIPASSGITRGGVRPKFDATTAGWAALGPGNIGGRTRALVINPQNPDIMYAGSVTGGVWKTTDGGKSWAPQFDNQAVLNVGTLAMDPTAPDTLYAGTGEWYESFQGNGIYKTTDGGATWKPLTATTNNQFYYVNKIVISPNDPQRIYAATWGGVWTSGNGGNTWANILSTKSAFYGCQDLAIRPDMNPDVVFASCSGVAASGDYQVFQNTAAPSTAWTQVLTQSKMGRTSLAIAPSQPSTIYALAADYDANSPYNDGLLGVYRSTSGGDVDTWTPQVTNSDPNPTNTLLLNNGSASTSAYCSAAGGDVSPKSGQGGYDNVIAVDPADPNIVWVGGIEVFRSNDGGMNWGVASLWQVPFGNPQFAHADRHVIRFHPAYDGSANQTMFLGTDGGIFRTDNARDSVATGAKAICYATFLPNSAIRWTSLNNSYSVTQFYHGFVYPGGMAYVGGAQDNSVGRGTDLGEINNWKLFGTGDGTSVFIDPADANHVLESKENLSMARAIDGGSFVSSTAGITESSASFPFAPFLASDPNDGNRIFLGGTSNLWRSLNGGASWTAAAPVTTKSGAVTSIAVSPADANTVSFGTRLGFVYTSASALTSDGATPWTSSQPRANAWVSGLAYDPTNPQIVYATYSTLKSQSTDAHVYKSMDGGVTWAPFDGSARASIPDTPVWRLLVNPYYPSTLYLGSDLGVFVSTDGGATWGHDPNEFSNVVVEELAFDPGPNPNWLFAFTYGRGAFRTPLSGSAAPNCSYSVNPTTLDVDGYGGAFPITVSAPDGCAWSGIPGATPSLISVQSPAQGSGNGVALVNVVPNTGSERSDTLTIANTAVTVNQGTAANIVRTVGDLSTNPASLSISGIGQSASGSLTSTAGDPVHSCTGSADFRTGWWRVTPSSNGTLQVLAYGRRTDVTGNSGIVVTAYPAANTGTELACATVPQDTSTEIDTAIRFAVTAGNSYLIEVSALGQAASYAGTYNVVVTMSGSPDVTLSISPAGADLTAGAGPIAFTAHLANAANPALRWSISPPLGTISQAGVYTPPASVGGPAAVTVTATTFGIPRKQATATLNLAPPGSGGGPAPVITAVVNAAMPTAAIAGNTWLSIYGTDLASGVKEWSASDFVAGQMPVQLGGVSVTINGHRAYLDYVSPTQVNVLAPLDGAVAAVDVVLSNANGASAPFQVAQAAYAPSFFLFDDKHVAALHANYAPAGPSSLGSNFSPAAPGEVVLLYASGFGEVTPGIIPGALAQSGTLPQLPDITIGGLPATVQYAGAISPGLYQFNVLVPPKAPSGDNALLITYQNTNAPPGVSITVR